MARDIRLLPLTDFTGGLNLRADAFQLRGAESPDMMNVDLDPRGGFARRDAVQRINSTAVSLQIKSMWGFFTSGGTKQIVVQQGNDLAYSTGGNFTAVNPDAATTAGTMFAATFNDTNYICRNAEQAAIKWDGSTSTVLGTTFNENFSAPDNGDMPKAKYVAAWGGYLWVANTNESSSAKPCRVRWSHPNKPEDWRSDDYIDIDIGVDGDVITGLAPFGDRLYVFKKNSVHVVTGYDADSFAVNKVADVGAIDQAAIATTEYGIYFFNWPEGVYFLSGAGSVSYAFERLQPLIHDGLIPATYHSSIRLGWVRRRLWVSIPYNGSTTNNRVLVLDPTINSGQNGAWTQYDLALGPMLTWRPPGSDAKYLGAHATLGRVLELHVDADTDDFGSGATNIESYYVTRWMDAEQPAVIKRWKRPELILDEVPGLKLRVDVWRDYNPNVLVRTQYVEIVDNGSGTALEWNVDDWDEKDWAGDSDEAQSIRRTGMLGRGRAVQLKFSGQNSPSKRWSVNAITLKFIPRKVRS